MMIVCFALNLTHILVFSADLYHFVDSEGLQVKDRELTNIQVICALMDRLITVLVKISKEVRVNTI